MLEAYKMILLISLLFDQLFLKILAHVAFAFQLLSKSSENYFVLLSELIAAVIN